MRIAKYANVPNHNACMYVSITELLFTRYAFPCLRVTSRHTFIKDAQNLFLYRFPTAPIFYASTTRKVGSSSRSTAISQHRGSIARIQMSPRLSPCTSRRGATCAFTPTHQPSGAALRCCLHTSVLCNQGVLLFAYDVWGKKNVYNLICYVYG